MFGIVSSQYVGGLEVNLPFNLDHRSRIDIRRIRDQLASHVGASENAEEADHAGRTDAAGTAWASLLTSQPNRPAPPLLRAMKIATSNINNINRRLPNLLEWLRAAQPDVVCLR